MTNSTIDFDPKDFRRALGNVSTVIAARAPIGSNIGATSSSFNSLLMDSHHYSCQQGSHPVVFSHPETYPGSGKNASQNAHQDRIDK